MFSPAIGPVAIDVFLSENHTSDLAITEIPVEFGADITDHAYSLPQRVEVEIATTGAANSFQSLKAWQKRRVPFTIVTGLDIYSSMLIKSITAVRDKDNAAILKARVTLQQIIIAGTAHAGGLSGLLSFATGLAGGINSLSSAPLSAARALGDVTLNRAAGTIMRGEVVTRTVDLLSNTAASREARSILSRIGGL